MKMSKLGYFSEFLLFPLLVLVAALFAFRSSTAPHPLTWPIVYGAGSIAWTLFEYLLHRVLFYHAPVLSQIHDRHHQSPHDSLTPRVGERRGRLACGCQPVLRSTRTRPRYRGDGALLPATLGVFVHYVTHHWRPRRDLYLYRVWMFHACHDHLSDSGNLG